jgi:hypothetical protein
MTPNDYDTFAEIVTGLAELKSKDLSGAGLKLYWRAMQDWTIEDFGSAAEHLLKTHQFFPTPADFHELRNAGKPTAAEAWARVLDHCKGAYHDGAGLDNGGPIDTAVSGLGGYRAIAYYEMAYLGVLQRQFVARYGEQLDAQSTRESVPQIARDRDTLRLDRLDHNDV